MSVWDDLPSTPDRPVAPGYEGRAAKSRARMAKRLGEGKPVLGSWGRKGVTNAASNRASQLNMDSGRADLLLRKIGVDE